MNPWSNRFVSLALACLVAACQSTPSPKAPAIVPQALDKSANAPMPGSTAAATPAATAAAEVPPQAAQQYADALRLARGGQDREAELEFKQLASAHPDYAGPQLNLGLLFLRSSRLLEAEASFTAVLAHDPNNAVAGDELGLAQRRLGKFSAAEATYRRTIEAAPEYAPTYLNLGILYDLYLAQPQQALEQYEHYLALTGGSDKRVAGWVVELRKRVGGVTPGAHKEPS